METCIGKIVFVSELNVQILLNGEKVKFHDVLTAQVKGKTYHFEVTEEDGNIVSAIPFQSVIGLKKGVEAPASRTDTSYQRYNHHQYMDGFISLQ